MIFWIILLGVIGVFVGGILLAKFSWDFESLGIVIAGITGMFLFMFLIAWPCEYCDTVDGIAQYKATKATLEASRTQEIDPLERAAIQQKIIETNQWLASTQYWNSVLDPMYPDEVESLEMLK